MLGAPARLWWSSLPLRMVAITLTLAIAVLLGGGMFLMQRAADGILAAKKESAVAEATTSLNRIQQELRATDLRTASLYERLNQLADDAASQSGQYHILIQGPVSGLISAGVSAESVPQSLIDAVAGDDGVFTAPTLVRYTDPTRASVPGLVVGATLWGPGGAQSFPIYFIFPEDQEVRTIALLHRVVLLTGAIITVALGLTTFLATRTFSRPIREASRTARRIADGQLDERMTVRGTDDLATLATSMNEMAGQLQGRIVDLEQLSTLQQQFVSDVSHELRTPLTTVRMAAEMIEGEVDRTDPVLVRSTELLRTELDRFEDLLADLLEISRFDAGAAVLALDEVDVVDLVRTQIDATESLAAKLGTPIRLHASSGAMAEVDPRRVRRIIRNLLSNAVEHGERRPIDVTVGYDLNTVAVTVRDHGIGFEPWQADKVFARFWRADPARVRTVGGTGLGLAISLQDAHLHHGDLQAWGRPGEGAQFRLLLPRHPGARSATPPLPLIPTDREVS